MRKYLTYLDNEFYLFWKIEVMGRSFTTSWGKMGTIGHRTINVADNDRECLRIAEDLVNEKTKNGYAPTGEGYITKYDLPDVLKTALSQKRELKTSLGTFVLPAFHDVKLISVVVDHHQRTVGDFLPALVGNPYSEQKGLFCTTAYSLISESPAPYPSEGLLVWLPLLELFGTWDRANRQLYLFPDMAWEELESNLPYLLSPDRNDRSQNMLTKERVLNYFDFIPEDLPAQVKWILSHPTEIKVKEAGEFLNQYEHRLLRHPWCPELEETYAALVTLYHRIGQVHEREAEYTHAIEWLGRSLLVVNQSQHFRSKIFIDIFIQLSFCYFETSQFDSSLRYMKMYQVYDSTAWETCEQIKSSISRVKTLYEDALVSCKKAAERRSAQCYEEAIRITHQAMKVAPNDPLLHFNLACFYSLSYKKQEALYHLEEAIKKGYNNPTKIVNEQDLENIRSTKEFKDIRQRYF